MHASSSSRTHRPPSLLTNSLPTPGARPYTAGRCKSLPACTARPCGPSRLPAAGAMSTTTNSSSLSSLCPDRGSWLGEEPRRHASRGQPCRGFVGEGASSTAGAYYSSDFTWESRIEEGKAALARQQQELAAWHEQQEGNEKGRQLSPEGKGPCAAPGVEGLEGVGAVYSGSLNDSSTSSLPSPGPNPAASPAAPIYDYPYGDGCDYDRGSWESFHSQHSLARFFKERRYLLLEFPALAVQDPPQHFVEIGCGCGSSLLPVLRANHTCRVTGCDISPTAVRLFQEAAERYGIARERVATFAFDAAHPAAITSATSGPGQEGEGQPRGQPRGQPSADSPPAESRSPLEGLSADAVLLIFTLSALPAGEMPTMLRHALCALRSGGLLLFRDYGLYDMAQLRFPGSQMLGRNLYRRGDGTLAYFFTPEGISQLAQECGFEVVEAEYACVALKNRKTGGSDMKRVFVHGVFRKPPS